MVWADSIVLGTVNFILREGGLGGPLASRFFPFTLSIKVPIGVINRERER